ncbi:sce7726 family protein [Acinetobacter sp. Marseille-Q1618]|uniref:sce7726 family protein n=1 Tax=Acinetobacter sp. Marseille-Q1618 TaxID=2697502 RepID=UPI0020C51045|nr:sce7726 family protein [Acinetobacter sp. Marseille-Q1618]
MIFAKANITFVGSISVFERGWVVLTKNQTLGPNDIRSALRSWIHDRFELKQNDILINELGFCNKDPNSTIDNSFRADLALANGRLVGFEIKSEKDNLKRWASQMVAYNNVFDEVWLCVHSKHLEDGLKITPKNIGILLIDDYESVAIVRHAKLNNNNNIYDLSGLLWREELNTLAKLNQIKINSRTTKNEVREILAENLSINIVRDYVLTQLKIRKSHQYSNSSGLSS